MGKLFSVSMRYNYIMANKNFSTGIQSANRKLFQAPSKLVYELKFLHLF